jgi:hypothetical protein
MWPSGTRPRALAAQHGLRGADAVYAAVAQQGGYLDLARPRASDPTGKYRDRPHPAAVLAELIPPTSPSSAM